MKRQFSGNFTEDQKRLFFFFWTIIKGKFVSAYHAQQSVSLLLFLGISPSPSMSCLRVWLASKSHGMTIGGGWKQWVSQDFEVFVCVCVFSMCHLGHHIMTWTHEYQTFLFHTEFGRRCFTGELDVMRFDCIVTHNTEMCCCCWLWVFSALTRASM